MSNKVVSDKDIWSVRHRIYRFFLSLYGRFYWWVRDHPPIEFNLHGCVYEYVPDLIAVRPLENGRLALILESNRSQTGITHEVCIYDLWGDYASRKNELIISRWFREDVFKNVRASSTSLYWPDFPDDLIVDIDSLLHNSFFTYVKEDFECVK